VDLSLPSRIQREDANIGAFGTRSLGQQMSRFSYDGHVESVNRYDTRK
jgi:hypothetical protein